MDEKALIRIAHISLFFPFVLMNKSFVVEFQSSGVWSKDEFVTFNGKIPTLKEFTSCHWERDTYFAISSTNIWSYCYHEKNGENSMKCAQLYYQGNRRVANRDVIFGGYFYGWTKIVIDIELPVKNFKHRTWNHFCWTYSSLTGRSSLYYNGALAADVTLPNDTVHPVIKGTEEVDRHLFVIGQEPDSVDGDYDEDQAVFGSISEFNIWDYVIDPTLILSAANCNTNLKGNIISWEKKYFDIKLANLKNIQNITQFCEKKQELVVFAQSHSKESAHQICSSHGGNIVLPKSKSEDQKVFEIMKNHKDSCTPPDRANSNLGKLIWLGLQSSSRNWYGTNGDVLSHTNYSNWGSSYKELNKPGWNGGCAFMTINGSWAYAGDECFDITLCFVCSIPRSTVLTLKGTCKLGSVFQWNYYPVVNNTNQLSSFEGYKRGQQISQRDGVWSLTVQGARIYLAKNVMSPLGRNQWNWYERSCRSQAVNKRNLTLSLCRVGKEFTCDSGHCVALRKRCDNEVDCEDGSDEKACARVHIPEEYDKDDPPSVPLLGDHVIIAYIFLAVEEINHIDTKNMIIQVTSSLTIWWLEPRLHFKNLDPNDKNYIHSIVSNKMWTPLANLEYKNAVVGKIRPDLGEKVEIVVKYLNQTLSSPEPADVSESREEYRYHPEKNILKMTQRTRVDYECIFDLAKYPFDVQACNIILKVKTSSKKKMGIGMTNDTIAYTGSSLASQLYVINTTSNIYAPCSTLPDANNPCEPFEKYVSITKDAVIFTIYLKRAPLYHIMTIFVPCIGLWFIAYLTTLLRVNDFTNRNRISVTVLLATVTLFAGTAGTDDYPSTTYLKYIDVWFLFYLSSILLIIIHHIALEMLWHDPNKVVHASNNAVGDMYDGEARKEKHDKQRYLKRISTIFFPFTIILFTVVYFSLTT